MPRMQVRRWSQILALSRANAFSWNQIMSVMESGLFMGNPLMVTISAMLRSRIRLLGIFAAFVLVSAWPLAAASQETALDRYVHAPDPSYKWELVNTIPGEGFKAYV